MTASWKRARRRTIDRDKSTCQRCRKVLDRDEVTIDHIVPLSQGGPRLSLDNLQCLCWECHVVKSDEDKVIYQTGTDEQTVQLSCIICRKFIKGKRSWVKHLRKEHKIAATRKNMGMTFEDTSFELDRRWE